MKKDSAAAYEELKRAILALGFVRPGTLVRRFMPCGKPSCRCAAGRASWHGPYFQWSHKIRGKTVTRRLSAAQAARCAEWIASHRALRRTVRQMESLSLRKTDQLLTEIS